MLTKEKIEDISKTLKCLCANLDKHNYGRMVGFLQRFYAINVIRDVCSKDERFTEEVNTLARVYLDDLYRSDVAKRYINGIIDVEDSERTPVTTLILINSFFPELLRDRDNYGTGVKEISKYIFQKSPAYQYCTPEFRGNLDKLLQGESDKSSYREVKVSDELKDAKQLVKRLGTDIEVER